MRIVLLGPPGAGKGTQAARVVAARGGAHLASGELLRDHIERGTALGRSAQEAIHRGELLADEVVTEMVLERLGAPGNAAAFVLDGFPRTVPQAEALDRHLRALGRPLDAVVAFDVPVDELLARLAVRAEREGRPEDADAAAVRRRLELYASETRQLLDYYSGHGLLIHVDGRGAEDEVTARLLAALAPS